MMKRLGQHIGTRRQLFRAMAAGAASIPLLALPKKSAAQVAVTSCRRRRPCTVYQGGQRFRLPQAIVLYRNCKLEMKFIRLPAVKPSSGSATTNSQRKKAGFGRIA